MAIDIKTGEFFKDLFEEGDGLIHVPQFNINSTEICLSSPMINYQPDTFIYISIFLRF